MTTGMILATTIAQSLRARLAPADAFEEVLFDQVVCAAEEVERVRNQRPDQADPKWLRHMSLAQGLFQRAHAQFLRHRKDNPATTSPAPATSPVAAVPATEEIAPPPANVPAPPASSSLSNLSRRDRRRYAALLRSAPSSRDRTITNSTRDPDASRHSVTC